MVLIYTLVRGARALAECHALDAAAVDLGRAGARKQPCCLPAAAQGRR